MSLNRFFSLLCGVAIMIATSTAEAQIDWAEGAPGGTTGGSIRLGADFDVTDAVGTGFFLETGISAAQIAPTSGADYTISAWINSQQPDTEDETLAQDNRWWFGTGFQGIHLGTQGANSALTQAHWGNDSTGATPILLDTWVHATYVYRAGVQEIYLNGVLDSSMANGAPNEDGTDLQIGSRNFTDGPGWDGFIDDVAMFTTALSPEQVADLAADASLAPSLGAVAYYNFEDDQTGTTAANLIPVAESGLTGTDGSPALQELDGIGVDPPLPPPPVTWAEGAPGGTAGGSLSFDGAAASGISTGISAFLVGGNRDAGSLGSDYTISMWINANETATGDAPDNNWFFGTGNQGLHLGVQAGNTLQQAHWASDTSALTIVPAETWVHATYTFDADGGLDDAGETTGLHTIYFNGVEDGGAAALAPNFSDTDLQIGSRNGDEGPGWNGRIDDVAIFTSVLTPTEIASLAADTTLAPSLGAAAYYNFEDDQSGTTALNLIDVGASGLTGTDGSPALQALAGIVPLGGGILGDANMDGVVDFFDIQPFIDILTNQEFLFQADINGDAIVDFFDIQPFIDILSGGA